MEFNNVSFCQYVEFVSPVSVPVLSWTDLIVGAPNFFDRKAEIGGAVYVYLNPFGHWDDQARPIRLNGTYDSMFGMTVGNIGDLDQDGYGGESKTNRGTEQRLRQMFTLGFLDQE